MANAVGVQTDASSVVNIADRMSSLESIRA
jgi:hypothetical protein